MPYRWLSGNTQTNPGLTAKPVLFLLPAGSLSCMPKTQGHYTESPSDETRPLVGTSNNRIYFNMLMPTEDTKIYGISLNIQFIPYPSVQFQ